MFDSVYRKQALERWEVEREAMKEGMISQVSAFTLSMTDRYFNEFTNIRHKDVGSSD